MKESKGVYVTKRDIRENLLNREYKLYNNNIVNTVEVNKYRLTNDVGIQYNSKRDNIFYGNRNLVNGKRYHDHELRYFNPIPKQIFTYSRSFTDIGVGSVKALQKKKVKKIYLPETDDRGVGSSDLTNFIVRMQSLQSKGKTKQYRTIQSYYESKRTSSKCVGGAVENRQECLVSAKVSPIVHTQSGSTSPKDPGFSSDYPKETKDSKDIEIGTVVIEKEFVTTDTQFEEPEVVTSQENVETIAAVTSEPKEEVRRTPKQSIVAVITSVEIKAPVLPSEPKLKVVLPEKKYDIPEPLKGSFSSDSLVQHVHNLEQPSEYSKQRDPMENKMEREYRKMFASISRDDKTDVVTEKQIPQKSTSLFRRRFTAIRKSLGKKDSKNAMGQNQSSVASVKDASVTSDPPSLEERSFSSINGYPGKRTAQKKASYKKSYTGKKSSKTWSKANAVDSEYGQGVKGMFKLWGKKFNLDDTSDTKEDITQPSSFNDQPNEKGEEPREVIAEPKYVTETLPETVIEEEQILEKDKEKKEGKKFFFFKKRHSKDKPKNQNMSYKNKKGVTTGRCEVKDGLSLRIGAARPPSPKTRSPTPTSLVRKQLSTPMDNYEDLIRAAWLMKYLSNPIESRNSVKIRWNNKTYTTSSSTIFELMGSVYKNTGVVLKSKSEITTEASSTWSYNRPNVNFVQQIEAWMVPKTITDHKPPVMTKNRSEHHVSAEMTKRENDNKNIEVTISDHEWIIDNPKAQAHKIEVVLHSKNFVKLQKPDVADYLRIDIPKGFFTDSSSDEPQPEHTSDEEVYNIVEYESLNSGPKPKQTQTISRVSNSRDDSETEGVQVTVSVKSGLYRESNIMETVIKRSPVHRSVAIQGNDVFIPNMCDIVGVGIITQREIREVEKPIIRVLEYLSDDESEHSLPKAFPSNNEFAKSYLQESYRHWQPQCLDIFSWCVSDSHMQCCTEHNSRNSYNNGDASKSCPNFYEEYVTQISSYSSGGCKNPKHPCYDLKKNKKEKEKEKEKEKKPKKENDKNTPYRVCPKDSLEVFKKRKIYAIEKSKWLDVFSVENDEKGPPGKTNAKSIKKTAKIASDTACTIPDPCCTKDSCTSKSCDICCPPQSRPPHQPPFEGDGPTTPAPCISYKSPQREQSAKVDKNTVSPPAKNQEAPVKKKKSVRIGIKESNSRPLPPNCIPDDKDLLCHPPEGPLTSCDDCCRKSPCYLRPQTPPQVPQSKLDCTSCKASPNSSVHFVNSLTPNRSCQTKQSMSPLKDSISPASSCASKSSRCPEQYKALDQDPCFPPVHAVSSKQNMPDIQPQFIRSNETQTDSTCPTDKSPSPSNYSESYNAQIPSPRPHAVTKCPMGIKFSNSDCIKFPKPQHYPLPKIPTPPSPPKKQSPQKTPPSLGKKTPPKPRPPKTPPVPSKTPKLVPASPPKCPKGLKMSNCINGSGVNANNANNKQPHADKTIDSKPNTAPCCEKQPCCTKISLESFSPKTTPRQINHVANVQQPLDYKSPSPERSEKEQKKATDNTPQSTVTSEVQDDSCPKDFPILESKSAPLQCLNKNCNKQLLDLPAKSQPNLEKGHNKKLYGIFLKKYPRNIDLTKTSVIRLNSKEKITFKLNDDNASIEENKGCYIKIKDEDNVTLVERKDYTTSSKQTLLDKIYNDTKVNRIATPITINNVSSVERENKIEESKSNDSVVNVIEINFKLRVIQGDKTTEINIGNTDSKIIIDDEKHKSNQKNANHLDDRAKEVYIVKDENTAEETNQKNDLNIRILIKNYKPKTEASKEKKAVEDFSQKISKKFNTVSTGYSIEHPDETCISVHRATIDLTTSNKSKETTSKEKMYIEGKKKGSDVKFQGFTVLSDEMLSHTPKDKTSVTENITSATEAESNLSLNSETVPLNSIALPTLSEHSKMESLRLSKHRSIQSISGMRYVFVDSKQPSSKNIEYLSNKSLNRSSRSIPHKGSRSDEGYTEKTFDTSESMSFKESKKAVVIKDLFKSQARLSFTDTDERDHSLGNKTSDEPTDLLGKTSDEHTDAITKSSEDRTDRTDRTDYGKISEDQETDTKTSDLVLEKIPIEEVDHIDLGKSKREHKKEMLKQVFDQATYFKKPKTKNKMQKLKDVLKALLTSDDTDSDTDHDIYNKVSSKIPKCAWDPQAKHNSDSLNNFFEGGSMMVSKTVLERKNLDSFQSNGSVYSEDEEKPKNKTCLCSNFAEKLKLGNIAGGGCCCRKMPEQVCEQVSCNFINEVSLEDYSFFAPSVECVPCQTNNSRYKSSIHCAKIMSMTSKRTSFITPQSGKTSFIEHSQGEPDILIVEPLSTKVSVKSHKSDLKDELKENSSQQGHFLRNAEENSQIEPVSAKMSIKISKIEKQVHEKSSLESHQPYRERSSTETNCAISEKDKVVYQIIEEKPEKSSGKRDVDKKRKHHTKIKNEADVLQMYETKKAVLEIYAEKTVTNDEEHFVANLPRFVRDTESQLYENYEHLERNSYKRVFKRNFVMMCIGR